MAPVARFGGARRSLGNFARSGDSADMRRGIGHYVRTGYGGARTPTRRFEGTTSAAGALYGALSSTAAGQAPEAGSPLDPFLLAGRSAREVMDAIIEAVRPADGTQDAEACRAAIKDALSELLTRFQQADLLVLTPEQRAFVIERFVAIPASEQQGIAAFIQCEKQRQPRTALSAYIIKQTPPPTGVRSVALQFRD